MTKLQFILGRFSRAYRIRQYDKYRTAFWGVKTFCDDKYMKQYIRVINAADLTFEVTGLTYEEMQKRKT